MNTYRIKLNYSIIPCFEVQIMKKFLFLKYWRTINSVSFLFTEPEEALKVAEKFIKTMQDADKRMKMVIR